MHKITFLSRVWWTSNAVFETELVIKGQVEPDRKEPAVLVSEVEFIAYTTDHYGQGLHMKDGTTR